MLLVELHKFKFETLCNFLPIIFNIPIDIIIGLCYNYCIPPSTEYANKKNFVLNGRSFLFKQKKDNKKIQQFSQNRCIMGEEDMLKFMLYYNYYIIFSSQSQYFSEKKMEDFYEKDKP